MGTSLLWQTDAQLHDAVERELRTDPEVDAAHVALIASDGVVTLTGFVRSYAAKLAAERAVKRVRGVRGVANDLHIALGRERTDSDIAKDAVHALHIHTSVPNHVTATVRNGFITLEGAVEWMFQKAAAGLAVAHLEGVKGVSNMIVIEPAATADRIEAQIHDAFGRSADLHTSHLDISVDGSSVTLYGEVRSLHEKQEAERAAWAQAGVTWVENLIVVAP